VALLTQEAAANDGSGPWGNAQGWRLNSALKRSLSFADEFALAGDSKAYAVRVTYAADGWLFNDQPLSLTTNKGLELHIKLGERAVHGTVLRDGEQFHVFTGGAHYTLHYNDPMAHAGEVEAEGGRLTAPMPGKVVAVLVTKGQDVKKGEPLVIMEAMKMEHTIAAPHDGLVEDVLYAVGDQVADGAPLLAFKATA